MGIDSNVLDGEVTALTRTITIAEDVAGDLTSDSFRESQIRDMDRLSENVGWVLRGNQIWLVEGENRWLEITPDFRDAFILDVDFQDSVSGWVAAAENYLGPENQIVLYQTQNGGRTWESHYFDTSIPDASQVYLNFSTAQIGWMMVTLQSGSSFSFGRLFFTPDGGQTWIERAAPLGEPVTFSDAQRGWITGGPAGNALFHTTDGGLTWGSQSLPDLPDGHIFIDLPVFENQRSGILPVTILDAPNSLLVLYTTEDGGASWVFGKNITLPEDFQPGMALPFSATDFGWHAATPGAFLSAPSDLNSIEAVNFTPALPGIIAVDFIDAHHGWAIAQDGTCQGEKPPFNRIQPNADSNFACRSQTRLLETHDGGISWQEISP
jgi:photosystem II stability/assembly factor-like uncharacterized protein